MPEKKYDPYFTELEKIEDFHAKLREVIGTHEVKVPDVLKEMFIAAERGAEALRFYGTIIDKSVAYLYMCMRGGPGIQCTAGELDDNGAGKLS